MASSTVLRELRRCAAFYSLSCLFTKVEAKKKDERHSLMEEVFYGSVPQWIKGAVHQLVDVTVALQLCTMSVRESWESREC